MLSNVTRPTPHLVLSIIGGAKNFRLDGRKKEVFKRGLIGKSTKIDMMNNNAMFDCEYAQ